jgi:tRNA 2-thiouridine synthesizing protein D
MKFALLVRAAPKGGALTPLLFAREAIDQGHEVIQIFFQGDGAHHANRLSSPPPAEGNAVAAWGAFAADSKVELILCSTAGLRRGVREANLAPGFRISGVGQWLEAAARADRVVVFGEQDA